MGVAVVTAGLTIIISEQFGAPGGLPPVLDVRRPRPGLLLSQELRGTGRRRKESRTGLGRRGGAGELSGWGDRRRGGAGCGDGRGGHRRCPHPPATSLPGRGLAGGQQTRQRRGGRGSRRHVGGGVEEGEVRGQAGVQSGVPGPGQGTHLGQR